MRNWSMTDLVLVPYNATEWQLREPLRCECRVFQIDVSKGFTTDLASIPRIARLVFPVNDLHRPAAVVHDWLYVRQRMLHRPINSHCWIKREDADRIFYELMLSLGVSRLKAWVMYRAVRVGGWVFFNRRARECGNPYYR
jgi:hypothetical protein